MEKLKTVQVSLSCLVSNLLSKMSQSSHHSFQKCSTLKPGFNPSVHPQAVSSPGWHDILRALTHVPPTASTIAPLCQVGTLPYVFTEILYPDIRFLHVASSTEHPFVPLGSPDSWFLYWQRKKMFSFSVTHFTYSAHFPAHLEFLFHHFISLLSPCPSFISA